MSKAKFGPRACVRELNTYEDVDHFVTEHHWALVSRIEYPQGHSEELYLTPSGTFIEVTFSESGSILRLWRSQ